MNQAYNMRPAARQWC